MDFEGIPKDLELELRALKKELTEAQVENSRLREVIIDNELQDELDFDCTSIEENICINGITYIATLVRDQNFQKSDIESFEKLFNILRSLRGKAPASKKGSKTSVENLLKIVEGKS